MPGDFLQELLPVFRAEALACLDSLALCMESSKSAPGHEQGEIFANAFRIAHNLKGAALTVGESRIASLAHALEDAFVPVREGASTPKEGYQDNILHVITILERMVDGQVADDEVAAAVSCISVAPSPLGTDAPKKARTRFGTSRAAAARPKPAIHDRRAPPADPPSSRPAVDSQQAGAEPASKEDFVRVPAVHLDRLLAQMSEMMVTRSRFEQGHDELVSLAELYHQRLLEQSQSLRASLAPFSDLLDRYVNGHQRQIQSFGYLVDELGAAVSRSRMLPLKSLAPVWRKTVREAAHYAGKKAHLNIEVGDIGLDKAILTALKEVMLHLLHNAVDHGIESPAVRAAAGKPEIGTISVTASLQGQWVVINVVDDGAGLDFDGIVGKAVELGLVHTDRVSDKSDRELAGLIFIPGFSTKTRLSHISGRGVGLDVAHKRLTDIGGSISVAPSPAGVGFVLTIPMRTLSIHALLLQSAASVCAIPVDLVSRAMRIPTTSCHAHQGGFRHSQEDGSPLRLLSLTAILGEDTPPESDMLTVVVLDHQGRRLGLIVDDIIGEQALVAKALPWNLTAIAGVSGLALLGDGSVSIILDPVGLFDGTLGDQAPLHSVDSESEAEAIRVLVVDDSQTTLNYHASILSAAGYDVFSASDGQQAWRTLQLERVDILVTDIEMPHLDGFELTKAVRSSLALKDLPIILVSNRGSEKDLAAGLEAGADEYIVKQHFEQQKLLNAITRLVRS